MCYFIATIKRFVLCKTVRPFNTRKHFSRMSTAHLPTVNVSVDATRCQYQSGWWWWLCPQVKKFEHVFSSDEHQMSVAGRWVTQVLCLGRGWVSQVPCPEGRGYSKSHAWEGRGLGILPCDLSQDACAVSPPPPCVH